MRTTLILNDDVARRAREAATRAGTTFGDYVTRALRAYLDRAPEGADEPFEMIRFGGPRQRHHEPAELKAALEQDDLQSHGTR